MKSIQVRTADGVRLVGMHLATERDERDLAVVLAHGFTVTTARPHVRRVAARFARAAGVVMVDFRGHGRSEGRSTAGDFEVLDVDATVRWAREAGYRRVATVGFSMGGAVVLRHAARSPVTTGLTPVEPVDAVVSVSAPSRWFIRDTRRCAGCTGCWRPRPGAGWPRRRCGPGSAAAGVCRRSGRSRWSGGSRRRRCSSCRATRDPYFGVEHGRALAAAAPGADYWELAGFGHAEGALTPALVDRIAGWVAGAARRAGTMRP